MNSRISGVLALAAFVVAGVLGSAQSLAQNAYITQASLNGNSSTVSVIDTATNTVTATVSVGADPLGVAVTPDGSKAYVTNSDSNTVSVIDTATNMVIGSPIPVGTNPIAFGVFIQPAQRFAGMPGYSNCYGQSVAAFTRQYRGLNAAAAALGFSTVSALQNVITAYCGG